MAKRHAFPNVTMFRDCRGKVRWRYRKGTLTVALGTDYGSDEFIRRFNAAVNGQGLSPRQATGKVHSGSSPGSLSTIIDSWYKSSAFVTLGPTTQYGYRNIAENLRKLHGPKAVADLQRRHVKDIMAKKADTPSGANNDLRIIRLLLDHAVDLDVVPVNLARGVRKFSTSGDGYHTWTEAEIEAYLAHHEHGSTAHTAMTIMLYTGTARSDAVELGASNIHHGRLEYRRKKMKSRQGVLVSIPVHPVLAECLSSIPDSHATFLQTERGEARSAAGLGNLMRGWADAAGLPDCTAHGLRKACARRLIEAGATPHEMMAVTGHKTLAEAQRYAETFDRSNAADRAMDKQRG